MYDDLLYPADLIISNDDREMQAKKEIANLDRKNPDYDEKLNYLNQILCDCRRFRESNDGQDKSPCKIVVYRTLKIE